MSTPPLPPLHDGLISPRVATGAPRDPGPAAPALAVAGPCTGTGVAPYVQAAQILRNMIRNGGLRPGERLPSARELQRRLGISSSTVNNALRVLKNEGLIYSVHGRGSYVRPEEQSTLHSAGDVADPPDAGRGVLVGRRPILDDPRPPYIQTADVLRKQIQEGRFPPGSKLPSARELQERFGIAGGTAQSALRQLKHEGLIYSVQGRGSYVRADPAESAPGAADSSDHSEGLAPYQQIAAELRQQITTGRIAPGAKMASSYELQQRYGVANMTARSALRVLRGEGLIRTIPGRGSFAAWHMPPSLPVADNEADGAGGRHTASTITDAALDDLYTQIAELRQRLAAFEPGLEATA